MKKYTIQEEKAWGIASLLFSCAAMAGILLAIFAPQRLELILVLLGSGIPLGILSLAVYIICCRSYLLIEEDSIVFPVTRAPKLQLKRNRVRLDEMKRVERRFYKGDGIISKNTYFYRFVLKNGLEFTETFYAYGKNQEKEIADWLKEKTRFIIV